MAFLILLINILSLFSAFAALLVLLFIFFRYKHIAVLYLFCTILAFFINYAAGIIGEISQIPLNSGELEILRIFPKSPYLFFFLRSMSVLAIMLFFPLTMYRFINQPVQKIFYFAVTILFLLLIIPQIIAFISPGVYTYFLPYTFFYMLIINYLIFNFALVIPIYYSARIPDEFRRLIRFELWFFVAFMFPVMVLDDILAFMKVIPAYNITDAFTFFALTTFVIISCIYILIKLPGNRWNKADIEQFLQVYQLTKREQDVFDELLKSKSYKEIADHLFISVDTVKTHVSRIYKKTGAGARQELKYILRDFINSTKN